MKTCMFLCFHVNFKHESTKTCMFMCSPFSAYFYPNYIIMVKGPLIIIATLHKVV